MEMMGKGRGAVQGGGGGSMGKRHVIGGKVREHNWGNEVEKKTINM